MRCRSCDTKENLLAPEYPEVCKDCFVEPANNNCTECGRHLEGIPYLYICGSCYGGNI